MAGHYTESTYNFNSDDDFAEAHTEAVNAGVFVKVNEKKNTLTILGPLEKIRDLGKKISGSKVRGVNPSEDETGEPEDRDDEVRPTQHGADPEAEDDLPPPPIAPAG